MFKVPKYVQDDLKKLLKDMLNYMTEIGQEICELAHLKWGHILEQCEDQACSLNVNEGFCKNDSH